MVIATHLAVSTVKNQAAEKHYGAWWAVRLKGVRLSGVTPACWTTPKGRSLPPERHRKQGDAVPYPQGKRHGFSLSRKKSGC